MPEIPYAWLGDVQTFLGTSEEEILRELTRFAREKGAPQLFAWDRSLAVLRRELATCLPGAAGFALVLEFELPRSGGRRPDLIVLENGTVLVIEFKNRVEAVLVPIGMDREPFERDGVRVVAPRGSGALIRQLAEAGGRRRGDARAWVDAPYEPLPALVQSARLLFERQPLPRIRRAESSRIPETVALIESTLRDARARNKRLLVLVTGVPGAGKTLVGLLAWPIPRTSARPQCSSPATALSCRCSSIGITASGSKRLRPTRVQVAAWNWRSRNSAARDWSSTGRCSAGDRTPCGAARVGSRPRGRSRQIRDPRRLRLNAYRVLLTRGRDGVVVFMPPIPAPAMDATLDALYKAGFQAFD